MSRRDRRQGRRRAAVLLEVHVCQLLVGCRYLRTLPRPHRLRHKLVKARARRHGRGAYQRVSQQGSTGQREGWYN
eukprot:753572-Hanusia_phi.AAC.10